MDPILNSQFNKFKQSFEIITANGSPEEQKKKEAAAFERFVNYTLFSLDYPDIFTANMDLLDFACAGEYSTGIDGMGIKVNDRLVRDTDEVKLIAQQNKKIRIDFVFIQTKMGSGFEIGEFNKFGLAVKNFFSEGYLPESTQIKEYRQIKDFIYHDTAVVSKLEANPSLYLYYVTTGPEPKDQNFVGTKKILENELHSFFFENISITALGGKQLTKACWELENKFEVQINIVDIFPLIVDPQEDIKKAYCFTCTAAELLKLLRKEDGTLRRSLFNDNVRDYLGKNAVNSEIEKTIMDNPGMFLLCNNGIAIVCNDFDQVRDKLVRIENPQIVNGCQTSNVIFNMRDNANIDKVQVVVRVISTDSLTVSNKIVRGTNKQNQVLDEAFEATLPFHQDILEPFFLALDHPVKIYYERRSRQYNSDTFINKTQIVNLRILTQTFVAMFLECPHQAHSHEAKLLEQYAGEAEARRVFREEHSPHPYYVCALTSYMFDKYFREGRIHPRFKTYKAHLCLAFKYSLGEYQPNLVTSKPIQSYCDRLILLLSEPRFATQLQITLNFFENTLNEWVERGNSKYSVKDRKEFSDLLIEKGRAHFIQAVAVAPVDDERAFQEGAILNVINRSDGSWFAFIERGGYTENLYFDNRSYTGDPSKLVPRSKVRYQVGTGRNSSFARNVQLMN